MAFYTDTEYSFEYTSSMGNDKTVVANFQATTLASLLGGTVTATPTMTSAISTSNYAEMTFPNGNYARSIGGTTSGNVPHIMWYVYTNKGGRIVSDFNLPYSSTTSSNGGTRYYFFIRHYNTFSGVLIRWLARSVSSTSQVMIGVISVINIKVTSSTNINIVGASRVCGEDDLLTYARGAYDLAKDAQVLSQMVATSVSETYLCDGVYTSEAFVYSSENNIFSVEGRYFIWISNYYCIELNP